MLRAVVGLLLHVGVDPVDVGLVTPSAAERIQVDGSSVERGHAVVRVVHRAPSTAPLPRSAVPADLPEQDPPSVRVGLVVGVEDGDTVVSGLGRRLEAGILVCVPVHQTTPDLSGLIHVLEHRNRSRHLALGASARIGRQRKNLGEVGLRDLREQIGPAHCRPLQLPGAAPSDSAADDASRQQPPEQSVGDHHDEDLAQCHLVRGTSCGIHLLPYLSSCNEHVVDLRKHSKK